MTETILIAAGGTGGHIFPGLAIAEQLLAAGAAVEWMGAGGMETALVQQRGLPLHTVPTRPPRRPWQLARLPGAVWRARRVIAEVRPAAVLCMGGYAAVPAGLAARLLRVPLIIHEQNAVPGKANRLLARFARVVLTGFPIRQARHQHVGNPVRAAFFDASAAGAARPRTALRHILVLGGSQGAQALNEIVPPAVQLLQRRWRDDAPLQVTHQCGSGNAAAVQARYAAHQIAEATVHEFIDDVAAAMAAADLVVCRAGAATLTELAASGVGALLVPYPHAAADHQTANARHYSAQGAARLCPQNELNTDSLASALAEADIPAMAAAAAAAAMPQAAAQAAAVCLEEARRAA